MATQLQIEMLARKYAKIADMAGRGKVTAERKMDALRETIDSLNLGQQTAVLMIANHIREER